MLESLLNSKKCFKLILGAGNQDLNEIEKIIYTYSKSGCVFFDIADDINVLNLTKDVLKKTNMLNKTSICVSTTVFGDVHSDKIIIDNKKCISCKKCISSCPNEAIYFENEIKTDLKKCIGCKKCFSSCPMGAISFKSNAKKDFEDFKNNINNLIENKIDCIELHINGDDIDEIYQKWEYLNDNFNGFLSICTSRNKFKDETNLKIVSDLIKMKKNSKVIIQADGKSMSGVNDNLESNYEALKCAQFFNQINLKKYVIISGGTNSKAFKAAKNLNIDINGVALGSFARKIIKNKNGKEALEIAKNLVDILLK